MNAPATGDPIVVPDRPGPGMNAKPYRTIIALALAFLMFLIPAAFNRAPIVYPDTLAYFQSGRAALATIGIDVAPARNRPPARDTAQAAELNTSDGVTTSRSPYYGATIALTYFLIDGWGIVALQGLIVLTAMWLALRRMTGVGLSGRVTIIAITTLAGGAGAFSGAIMPDVFAGVLILAIATYVTYARTMRWPERSFWLVLVFACVVFHKSHLAVAVLQVGAAILIVFVRRSSRRRSAVELLVPLLLGILGNVLIDVGVRTVLRVDPVPVPFKLARLVGDGTAERYLNAHCGATRYEVCRFVSRMPMTENEFLWSKDPDRGAWGLLDSEQKRRVGMEENAIFYGTLKEHFPEQVGASITNAARQFLLVGISEYGAPPSPPVASMPWLAPLLRQQHASRIGEKTAPVEAVGFAMTTLYFVGMLMIAWCWLRGRAFQSPGTADIGTMAPLILAGITLNAIVCGMISGVFDRYQGRVAWVAPLVALAWLAEARRERRLTTTAPAAR